MEGIQLKQPPSPDTQKGRECPGLTSAAAGSLDSTYTERRRPSSGAFFWLTNSAVSAAETEHNRPSTEDYRTFLQSLMTAALPLRWFPGMSRRRSDLSAERHSPSEPPEERDRSASWRGAARGFSLEISR